MSTSLRFSKKVCGATTAAGAAGGELQDEMITEILLRLPVRYLVQFEVVCKSWQSKIKSPKFIKLHMKRTAAEECPKPLFIHSENLNFGVIRDYIGLHWPQPKSDRQAIRRDLSLPNNFRNRSVDIPNGMSYLTLNGVANGIVCAMNVYGMNIYGMNWRNNNDHSIILWNPATLRSKELPVPIIDNSTARYLSVGFGFDSKADDYKVVRVVFFKEGVRVRAEVYSANEMCWKEIQVGNTFLVKYYNKCDICVDGMLYWSDDEKLVTYDLNTEKFNNRIELPKVKVTGWIEGIIVEFMDSVAFSVHSVRDFNDIDGHFSLWNLDDASGKGSWSKKFSFEAFGGFTRPDWLHLKNGSVVARQNGDSELVLYDPINKKHEFIWLPKLLRRLRGVYTYSESLVSIPGSEQVKSPSTQNGQAEQQSGSSAAEGVSEGMGPDQENR